MSVDKKIMICGFPRSGTTMLYYQTLEKVSEKTLYEPCNVQIIRWFRQYMQYRDIDKYMKSRTHPYFKKKIIKIIEPYTKYFTFKKLVKHYIYCYPGNGFLKDIKKLELFLQFFKDFNIKDVSLHLYLDENFVKNYWDVFFIIRHPADVYMSHIKSAPPQELKKLRIYNIIRRFRFMERKFIKFLKIFYYDDLSILSYFANSFPDSVEKRFVLLWTVTNYYAINKLPQEKVIIYEKLNTYKRLPFKIEENEIKVKIYEDFRDKYERIFEKLAQEIGIDDMFEYLMRLII